MKRLDVLLFGVVCVVWGVLALMYATVPMIQMPTSFRVWGLGAVLFLILTVIIAVAGRKGRKGPAEED